MNIFPFLFACVFQHLFGFNVQTRFHVEPFLSPGLSKTSLATEILNDFKFSFRCRNSENQQLTQPCGDTSVDSESVVKQNNFVWPNETTVVESGNVYIFLSF